MLRLTLPSPTLCMLGIEAIFGNFFLSLLGMNVRWQCLGLARWHKAIASADRRNLQVQRRMLRMTALVQ